MHIRMGMPVYAENGLAGHVQRVVILPETHELVEVVVRDHNAFGREVVVPEDRVTPGDNDWLRFRGTTEELSDMEGYSLSQYTEPPEEWLPPQGQPAAFYLFPASPYTVGAFEQPATQPEPAPHEVEALDPGEQDISVLTPVFCRDGEAGHLDRVVTDARTDQVTHLVVRTGLLPHDHAVPTSRVDRVAEDGVYLTLTRDELHDLPDYDE